MPGKSIDYKVSNCFSWRKGIFGFLAVFGLLVVCFYLFIGFVPIYSGEILPGYLRFIAGSSAKILMFSGETVTVNGEDILSYRYCARIAPGCDAIEATGLFVCAVLAFPSGFRHKVTAIFGGVIALAVLNLVRIVCLFLIGIHWPRIVEFMHIEVWQGLFIIFAVMLWVLWLLWIARNQPHIQSVSPTAQGGS